MAGPYYVDVTTGDDGDTGLSEALAFATLGFAANTIAAGEICYVKASASYTADDPDTATTCWEVTTVGTATTPIVWEGYTTTPGDGGVVTVDAQDTNTSALLISGTEGKYNVFKNFHFTQADGTGVSGAGMDHLVFKNCRSSNNAGDGFNIDNYNSLEGCLADTNTSIGFNVDSLNYMVCCVAHTNTSTGFSTDGQCYVNCMSYNNGTQCFFAESAYGQICVGCTFDGDNSVIGANFRGTSPKIIVNCIFYDCSTGIISNNDNGEWVISRNNLFYSNGTDRTNWLTGEGDVSGSSDPFTDSAGRDYSLKSGSEAIDAGYDASQVVSDWGL